MRCLCYKIKNLIHNFFHPTPEFIIKMFSIVEKYNITEEEAKELLKLLDEWEKHDS